MNDLKLSMTEAQFQEQVIDYAHLMHWRVAHFRAGMTKSGNWVTPVSADGAGFPDLVMVRRGRLIFAELKSERGRLSPNQEPWIDDLTAFGPAEVYLWKPSMWSGIVEVLK